MTKNSALYIVACLILLYSTEVCAQGIYITVLAAKGKPFYQNAKKNGWNDLSTGTRLVSGTKVKLSAGDYCALASSSGGTLELSDPGNFSFEDILHRIGTKKQSVTRKVINYISDKLSSNSDSKNMKSLGAVVRASRNHIASASPNKANVLHPVFQLSWYHTEDKAAYLARIFTDEGKTIFMQSTADSSVSLNTMDLQLRNNTNYYCVISRTGQDHYTSDTLQFRCLDDGVAKAIVDSLANMVSSEGFQSSALANFVAGVFLEQHDCNYDASAYFEKAINLSSGASGFLEHCITFYIRTGQDWKALDLAHKFAK